MAWLTNRKTGKVFNTEWAKERQIKINKKEADVLNSSRLKSGASIEALRKELNSILSNNDSYTNTDKYIALVSELHDVYSEKKKLEDKQIELIKRIKEGSVIDEQTLKEFDGNRQLASLFAIKNEDAQRAEVEFSELQKELKTITERYNKAYNKLNTYERKQHEIQKKQFEGQTKTLSTNVKADYIGFEKDTHTPMYQELFKKGKAYIVEMSPKEYLQRCAIEIFHSTYEKTVRAVLADTQYTYELADMMSSGVKMYMPMLNYKDEQQEGRHRAAAAILNGIKRIPVLIVPKK